MVSTGGEIIGMNVGIIFVAGSHNFFIEKKSSNRFELKLNFNLPGMMITIFLCSCLYSPARSV